MKLSSTGKTHTLILVIGIILITVGIFTHTQQWSVIPMSIGGVLFGLSLSWMIEELFKKQDERYSSEDYLKTVVRLIESALKKPDSPREIELQIFRESIMHFYYSTKDESGQKFWNYTHFNFKLVTQNEVGRLQTTATIFNRAKTESINYTVEMFRKIRIDPIVIAFRRVNSGDPVCIGILDPYHKLGQNICGLLYHDDWSNDWCASPCILTFKPIIEEVKDAGPLPSYHEKTLSDIWTKQFKDKRSLFQ